MFTRAISQEEKRSREKLASISPIYYYHYQYYYPRRGYCQVSLLLLRLEHCFECANNCAHC